MINIKIGSDGKPNEVTVIVGNKGENLDETLQFEMPNEFVGFHKYLVVVNKKQEETKTMVFPIVDNQLTITYDITKEPGKYSMYVMAREYELETLEGEIVLTPKSYERVFISDALIGVVNDTEIESEMFVNENTALQPTVTVFPKTKEQYIRPKVGFYGLSKVVVKSIYDDDEETLVPNRNCEFTKYSGQYKYRYMTSGTLIENDKYKVVWDGYEYYCTCRNSSNGLFIGNASYCGEADDKIPFVIVKNEPAKSMDITSVYDTSPTTHNIEFYHLVYRFQTKTVTPTEEQQTIVADDGFYGLEKVIVEQGGLPKTVVCEGTPMLLASEGGMYMYGFVNNPYTFVGSKEYTVNFDGVEYSLVGVEMDGAAYIGNASLLGMGEDTGEPLFIMGDDGMILIVCLDASETEHTIKITTEASLLPDGGRLGVAWDGTTDGLTLAYTKGRKPVYKVSNLIPSANNAFGVIVTSSGCAYGMTSFEEENDGGITGTISGHEAFIIVKEEGQFGATEVGLYFVDDGSNLMLSLVFDEA